MFSKYLFMFDNQYRKLEKTMVNCKRDNGSLVSCTRPAEVTCLIWQSHVSVLYTNLFLISSKVVSHSWMNFYIIYVIYTFHINSGKHRCPFWRYKDVLMLSGTGICKSYFACLTQKNIMFTFSKYSILGSHCSHSTIQFWISFLFSTILRCRHFTASSLTAF